MGRMQSCVSYALSIEVDRNGIIKTTMPLRSTSMGCVPISRASTVYPELMAGIVTADRKPDKLSTTVDREPVTSIAPGPIPDTGLPEFEIPDINVDLERLEADLRNGSEDGEGIADGEDESMEVEGLVQVR
jgi:hypothetical protein